MLYKNEKYGSCKFIYEINFKYMDKVLSMVNIGYHERYIKYKQVA